MSAITWTCHACGETRDDAFISVAHLRAGGLVPIKLNARYCNDRLSCLRLVADVLDNWAKGLIAGSPLVSPPPRSLYDDIRALLVRRGWALDPSAVENLMGEVLEFIHPDTGERCAWLDAILAEQIRAYPSERG